MFVLKLRTMRVLLALPLLLLGACSVVPPRAPEADTSRAPEQACKQWLALIDRAIAQAGVADGGEARVAGFAHLRADRFAAALATDAKIGTEMFVREVIPYMRQLDQVAREAELSNLSDQVYVRLGKSRAVAALRTQECAQALMRGPTPERTAIVVPDDYSMAMRMAGAYPIAKIPFTSGVRRHLDEVSVAFARSLKGREELPSGVRLVRYAPLVTTPAAGEADAALLERHQPVLEKEIASPDDLPGTLEWDAGAGMPTLNTARATVYRHVAFTRYHGQTLRQLVYTFWFGARPATGPGDLLAGHLDGLIWRVTLDSTGSPLIYDTIHPCGCYHYFFPTKRATPIPAPDDEPEWAFVPQYLAGVSPQERVVLRVAASTQYLERVLVEPEAQAIRDAVAVPSLPQDALRRLAVTHASGATLGTHSAYGATTGLVPGTERAERWLFWPMGIVSAGQMRQWGRHATAFVGKRHFDDADLFEKRFVFKLAK